MIPWINACRAARLTARIVSSPLVLPTNNAPSILREGQNCLSTWHFGVKHDFCVLCISRSSCEVTRWAYVQQRGQMSNPIFVLSIFMTFFVAPDFCHVPCHQFLSFSQFLSSAAFASSFFCALEHRNELVHKIGTIQRLDASPIIPSS